MSGFLGAGSITETMSKNIRFEDSQVGNDLKSRCKACGHEIWTFASYAGARPKILDHNRAKGNHRAGHYDGLFSNKELL